jgi:hypothetical protein
VSADAYARLWRLLARRCNDEFFAMDPRGLRSGSLAFLCRAAMGNRPWARACTALDFLG